MTDSFWEPSREVDPEVLSRHRQNLIVNLSRRMAIATAHQDQALLDQLHREQRQLEESWRIPSSKRTTFQRILYWWRELLNSFKLQVELVSDASGQQWWYGYDPRTGKTIYAETEADIIHWIEENQLG